MKNLERYGREQNVAPAITGFRSVIGMRGKPFSADPDMICESGNENSLATSPGLG